MEYRPPPSSGSPASASSRQEDGTAHRLTGPEMSAPVTERSNFFERSASTSVPVGQHDYSSNPATASREATRESVMMDGQDAADAIRVRIVTVAQLLRARDVETDLLIDELMEIGVVAGKSLRHCKSVIFATQACLREAAQVVADVGNESSFNGLIAALKAIAGALKEHEVEGTLVLTAAEQDSEMRRRAILELVLTERDYVRDLDTIERAFKSPLKRLQILSAEDMHLFFGEIGSLAPLSAKLLFELESRVGTDVVNDAAAEMGIGAASTPTTPRASLKNPPLAEEGISSDLDVLAGSGQIGDVFERAAEFLKLYTIYCANQGQALNRLEELQRTNADFARFLSDTTETDQTVKGLPLNAYLIKPVQRICKYPMLLDALIKHTPHTHADYQPLVRAKAKVDAVVAVVNEKKRTFESQQKMLEVQSAVIGMKGLVQPQRLYVREGDVMCQVGNRKDKPMCRVFLFNDTLLVTERNMRKLTLALSDLAGRARQNKYHLKSQVNLPESRLISIHDDLDTKYGKFVVVPDSSNKKTQQVTFFFTDPAERESWYDSIHALVKQQQQMTLDMAKRKTEFDL